LAAWDLVCKPKKCGGLGVVDFQKQNVALLIKFLDKFYNKKDLPWVHLLWSEYYLDSVPHADNLRGSFWWRDVLKQVDNFRGISSVKPGKGDSFLFWLDSWSLDGSTTPLMTRYSSLFSYVLDENIAAAKVFEMEDLSIMFQRPLSRVAFEEFNLLQDALRATSFSDRPDVWTYTWGERYTAAKFYQYIHSHMQAPKVYHWIWKSSCQMSIKFFVWMILKDRLNTRDMLQRRHWRVTDETHCVMCSLHAHEDRVHLFFECNFSQRVWNYLQIAWASGDDVQAIVQAAKASFGKPFFMEVVATACRQIWLLRNAKIFRHERPTFAKWKSNFVHNIFLLRYRIKAKYLDGFTEWINSLP
jgi:hypothetical protein